MDFSLISRKLPELLILYYLLFQPLDRFRKMVRMVSEKHGCLLSSPLSPLLSSPLLSSPLLSSPLLSSPLPLIFKLKTRDLNWKNITLSMKLLKKGK